MLRITILMLLMSTVAFANATTEPAEEPFKIAETVDCGSVSQLDLFRRARIWLIKVNPEREPAVADKETGDLIAATNIYLTVPRSEGFAGLAATFRYVVTIECVNRKYRATISDVAHLETSTGKYTPLSQWSSKDKVLPALETQLRAVLADLKQHVKSYQTF